MNLLSVSYFVREDPVTCRLCDAVQGSHVTELVYREWLEASVAL